jgi:glycine reductase
VLEKEIERAGIPTVLITALVPTARTLNANRIMQGVGITNPLGDPRVSGVEEKVIRRRIVLEALQMLTHEPTVDKEPTSRKSD